MRSFAHRTVLTGTLLLFGVGVSSGGQAAPKERPVEVFAKLDGRWEGEFVGYDQAGKELYRIKVTQTYRTVNETTQKVEIRDELAPGKVITGTGENVARRRPDGSLSLKCTVRKSNGEQVVHDGRLNKSADGKEQLIWFSHSDQKVETFRETVRRSGEEWIYSINGMGRYGGDTLILMEGRYRKVSP